jgi:hypothetical protein
MISHRNKLIALTILACFVTEIPTAQALLPHEVSGSAQYTETLPAAGGGEPTGGSGTRGDAEKPPAEALGKGNAEALETLGPDGKEAMQLAAAGMPDQAPRGYGEASGDAYADGTGTGSSRGNERSGSGQVFGQITGISDSEGMGTFFPLLMIVLTASAAVFVATRLRNSIPRN